MRSRCYIIIYLLFASFHVRFGYKQNGKLHKKLTNTNATNHSSRCNVTRPTSQTEFKISKKSDIEDIAVDLDKISHEKKSKREFLTSLANLLKDADTIATHKRTNAGLSSITRSEKHISLLSKKEALQKQSKQNDSTHDEVVTSSPPHTQSSNNTIVDVTEANKDKEVKVAKTEEVANADEIAQVFKNSSTNKEFAPIFAMFHGKIIPLGKLADTSFKKSHTSEVSDVTDTNLKVKDVTANKRTFNDNLKTLAEEKIIDNDFNLESSKLSKLQQYLTNLDGHVPPTGDGKSSRGVAKDEVVFPPDEESTLQKGDLMSHVKGVVLDSGKVVSVNSNTNHVDIAAEEPSKEAVSESTDEKQKFYVTDDGPLNPMVKSKLETGETVVRDTTLKENSNGESQKTVAISLDVLKDLLKKTDTKISLASLLNKPAETKSDTAVQDEEDPGTIEDFAAGGLKSHNQYRTKHHDSSLIWSDDLAAKAQKLAESLADKKTLEIAKDLEKEGYGENVAKVWATFKNAGEAATKMWYSQSDNYHFDDPHLDENTGQFAQVVWKSTKEIGMGVAKSIDDVNNKYVYVTSLYRPPGNIEAQLRENVLPTGNNTVDVYTTFFKRTGVASETSQRNVKKSKVIPGVVSGTSKGYLKKSNVTPVVVSGTSKTNIKKPYVIQGVDKKTSAVSPNRRLNGTL